LNTNDESEMNRYMSPFKIVDDAIAAKDTRNCWLC